MTERIRCLIIDKDSNIITQYKNIIPANIEVFFIDNELTIFNRISFLLPTFIIFNISHIKKPIAIISKVKKIFPDLFIIIVTKNATIREAIFFVKNYAEDYFSLPLVVEDFQYSLSKILNQNKNIDFKQSNRLMYLGELAAEIAHDIKTPLSCISGFISLFLNFLAKPSIKINELQEVQHYLHKSIAETKRCQKILDNLLHFSKKEMFSSFLLEETIIKIRSLLETKMKEKNISFSYTIPENFMVYGCEGKLHQVLLNVIINAKNSMTKGKIQISAFKNEEIVKIKIQDNGVGIAKENLGKIFTAFYTKTDKGTGLGLSIAKKIIDEHGGSIYATSKLNIGSIFSIELPVK